MALRAMLDREGPYADLIMPDTLTDGDFPGWFS
jgi:hypothetical protein